MYHPPDPFNATRNVHVAMKVSIMTDGPGGLQFSQAVQTGSYQLENGNFNFPTDGLQPAQITYLDPHPGSIDNFNQPMVAWPSRDSAYAQTEIPLIQTPADSQPELVAELDAPSDMLLETGSTKNHPASCHHSNHGNHKPHRKCGKCGKKILSDVIEVTEKTGSEPPPSSVHSDFDPVRRFLNSQPTRAMFDDISEPLYDNLSPDQYNERFGSPPLDLDAEIVINTFEDEPATFKPVSFDIGGNKPIVVDSNNIVKTRETTFNQSLTIKGFDDKILKSLKDHRNMKLSTDKHGQVSTIEEIHRPNSPIMLESNFNKLEPEVPNVDTKMSLPELISTLLEPIVKLSEQLSTIEVDNPHLADNDHETNLEIKTTVNAWTKKKKPIKKPPDSDDTSKTTAVFETLINDVGTETKEVQTTGSVSKNMSTSTETTVRHLQSKISQQVQTMPEKISMSCSTENLPSSEDHYVISLKHMNGRTDTQVEGKHEKTVQTSNQEQLSCGTTTDDFPDDEPVLESKMVQCDQEEVALKPEPKPNAGVMSEEEFAKLLSRRLEKLTNTRYYPIESRLEGDCNQIKVMDEPTSVPVQKIEQPLKPGSKIFLKPSLDHISDQIEPPKTDFIPETDGFHETPLNLPPKPIVVSSTKQQRQQCSSVQIFKMLTKDPEKSVAKFGLQSCYEEEETQADTQNQFTLNNRRLYTLLELPESSRSSMSDMTPRQKSSIPENGATIQPKVDETEKCKKFSTMISNNGSITDRSGGGSINSETSSMSGVGKLGAYKVGELGLSFMEENVHDYSQVITTTYYKKHSLFIFYLITTNCRYERFQRLKQNHCLNKIRHIL